jgi:hypothetical protein
MNAETTDPNKPRRRRTPSEKKQKSQIFHSRLDIAKMLGSGPSMVISLEKAGLLTPYKFGKRFVRYPAAEVQALIDSAKGAK